MSFGYEVDPARGYYPTDSYYQDQQQINGHYPQNEYHYPTAYTSDTNCYQPLPTMVGNTAVESPQKSMFSIRDNRVFHANQHGSPAGLSPDGTTTQSITPMAFQRSVSQPAHPTAKSANGGLVMIGGLSPTQTSTESINMVTSPTLLSAPHDNRGRSVSPRRIM